MARCTCRADCQQAEVPTSCPSCLDEPRLRLTLRNRFHLSICAVVHETVAEKGDAGRTGDRIAAPIAPVRIVRPRSTSPGRLLIRSPNPRLLHDRRPQNDPPRVPRHSLVQDSLRAVSFGMPPPGVCRFFGYDEHDAAIFSLPLNRTWAGAQTIRGCMLLWGSIDFRRCHCVTSAPPDRCYRAAMAIELQSAQHAACPRALALAVAEECLTQQLRSPPWSFSSRARWRNVGT